MADCIEREPFIDGLKQHYYNPADYEEDSSDEAWAKGFNAGLNHAIEHAAYAPAADVRPVVQCKDCLHHYYAADCAGMCKLGIGKALLDEDFCSRGELAKEATNDG